MNTRPGLVERGVPLAQVRDLLGHASILTTERYDNQKLEALQAAVERLEGGQSINASPTALTPQEKSSEVIDTLLVGDLVAVRGIEPRSRG
jgi:hypothetical protein